MQNAPASLRNNLVSLWQPIRQLLAQHPFPFWVMAAIGFVHFILSTYGIDVINIDRYPHLIPMPEMREDFWQGVRYYHVTPLGLSFVYKASMLLGSGDAYRTFTVLLPLLHAASFAFFYFAMLRFGIRVGKLFYLITLCNPLIFVYFKYPFSCTFLFFQVCVMLWLLARFHQMRIGQVGVLIFLLCWAGFLRSSFSLPILAIACGLLCYRFRGTRWAWA